LTIKTELCGGEMEKESKKRKKHLGTRTVQSMVMDIERTKGERRGFNISDRLQKAQAGR